MATASAELLRTLPQPQVSITVGYSLGQKLGLVAWCLRQAGLERTLSVLEREAAVKGVDLIGAGASAGAGAKAEALAEDDAASLEKHTALCLAELQREASGGAVAVACVMEDPAHGAAKKAHEPPPQALRPSPKPKPAARAAEAHTLDDILGDDVDYSDEEEDAGDTRREEDVKPTPAAALHEPRKSRDTPQRSEVGARESRGRADERAVGIEPPRGAAPRPTWIGNGGKEAKGDRDREREPARGAPAASGRDWQREPAGWERGRAEPRRDEPPRPRRDGRGDPPRGGPSLPPPPPLPAGRMSGGRGPPFPPPPPPPPPPPHYGRQAPLPQPPPPPGKRQRY